MYFHKVDAGHYRSYDLDDDVANIVKHGSKWKLEITNRQTGETTHSFEAPKEYLCEQEANRFAGHGAYADGDIEHGFA